jgi:hypothetical protein
MALKRLRLNQWACGGLSGSDVEVQLLHHPSPPDPKNRIGDFCFDWICEFTSIFRQLVFPSSDAVYACIYIFCSKFILNENVPCMDQVHLVKFIVQESLSLLGLREQTIGPPVRYCSTEGPWSTKLWATLDDGTRSFLKPFLQSRFISPEEHRKGLLDFGRQLDDVLHDDVSPPQIRALAVSIAVFNSLKIHPLSFAAFIDRLDAKILEMVTVSRYSLILTFLGVTTTGRTDHCTTERANQLSAFIQCRNHFKRMPYKIG